jgi:hypothetical protein
MANGQLQGWSADPFGLHEQRYFSAGRATKLVRDGKVESYEDPPSDTYEVADDAADDAAEAERSGPRTAVGRSPRAVPPRAGPPHAAPPRAGVSGQYPRIPRAAPRVRKTSHALLIGAAAAIVAGTVAGMLVLVKQESRSTAAQDQPRAISTVAFVSQSAARTLAERTADVLLSGTVESAGRTVTVNGTGEIDFRANAMQLSLNAGGSLAEMEILVNGNLYLTLSISGTSLTRLDGGREWLQMPLAQSASAGVVGSDPLSSLSLLEQQGVDVRTLGTRIVEGVSCTGYAVTPTKAALLEAVRTEFARLGFSPVRIDQEVSLAEGMPPPTVTVWLDAQGLVREMSMNLGTPGSGLGSAVAGSMVLDFSHYGAPVQIGAPEPSDTISYSSFLRILGAKG